MKIILQKIGKYIGVIIFFYLLAIFANNIAPYSPHFVPDNVLTGYNPPVKWQWHNNNIKFIPQIVRLNKQTYIRQTINSPNICSIRLFGHFDNHFKLIYSPDCPTEFNILGTDKLGRDYLSRLIHGLRPSLYTALIGILITFPVGIIYGLFAGYYKDTIGELMMRFIEIILSLPSLYLLVILAGILPPSLTNLQRLIMITIILSFISWAGLARIVRGQVMSILNKEFVQIAVLQGSPTWRILLREILPQLSSYLIIAFTISFPIYILGETSLSFLGLGINQPDSSLGLLLAEGKEMSNLFLRPWLTIIPSSILIILAWNCNTLGDVLRNIFDIKTSTINNS